jgi:hypothetical protein
MDKIEYLWKKYWHSQSAQGLSEEVELANLHIKATICNVRMRR